MKSARWVHGGGSIEREDGIMMEFVVHRLGRAQHTALSASVECVRASVLPAMA